MKGYLPVRLRLISQQQQQLHDIDDDDDEQDETESEDPTDIISIDETYIYIKEHNGSEIKDSNESGTGGRRGGTVGATLFVANCPTIPNISTKLLLQSIFGRYGDVARVTVIPKLPNTSTGSNRMASFIEVPNVNEPYRWTERYAMIPSYYKQNINGNPMEILDCEGKFAHIVFSSSRELKRTFRTLHEIMSTNTSSTGTKATPPTPAVILEPIELQTLMDESDRQWQEQYNEDIDDDVDVHDQAPEDVEFSALQLVAQQYRSNCQRYKNRHNLLEECNRIMELYEDEETAAERRRKEMTQQPDDDGFITVSYQTKSVSSTTTNELEQAPHRNNNKRTRITDGIAVDANMNHGSKRTRNNRIKKKKGLQLGSLPIPDFYRFQTRQQQQNSITELRQRFEQDKIRIFQKMNNSK
jgi:hypothetical protein